MKKKGAAHFEMIMAFTFFVGFVFFLFITLDNNNGDFLIDSTILGLQGYFKDIASIDLASIFLKVDHNKTKECFVVDLQGIFVSDFGSAGSLAKNLRGEELASKFVGNGINIGSYDDFFRVTFSEEFTNDNLPICDDVVFSYEVGGVVEKEVLSYSRLEEMRGRYFGDYDGLKKDLKVPDVFDFAIVMRDFDELSMLPIEGIPEGVDVVARDGIFEVLKADGELSDEHVNFRIW